MRKRKALPPPRPRTRAVITGTRYHSGGTYQWTLDGVVQPLGVSPPSVTVTQKRTDDIVTPGYQQLVAAGALINNPYSSVKTQIEGGQGGDITVEWKDGAKSAVLTYTGMAFRDACYNYSTGAKPVLPSYHNLIGYTQTKALSGVEAASLQTGVAIAEFRETMRMLVSPLRGLTRWVQNAQKRHDAAIAKYGRNVLKAQAEVRNEKFRRKVQAAYAKRMLTKKTKSFLDRYIGAGSTAADLVLSYNLGWKPFLSDIDALLHKIPSLEAVERRWSRATREQRDASDDTFTKSTSYGVTRYKVHTEATAKVRAGVLYQDRFEVSHHFGTRLADIPETVWEAIPGSFLVDYIVNVGDYLGALRAQAYSQNVMFYTTLEVEAEATKTWDSIVSIIAHPGVNNVVGSVKTWLPSGPEILTYVAKSRNPDSFGPSLAKVQYSHERPAAQLQNVLSLLTNTLVKLR